MKYFAKLLPTGKEVRRKTGTTVDGEVGKCLRENDEGYDYYQEIKMFLCSRDIQIGDSAWHEKHLELGVREITNIWKDISKYPNTVGWSLSGVLKEHLFKVIGEISSEAIWVKEGDEFEENEIEKDDYYTSTKIWIYKIKGPCGHFH